MNRFLVSLFNLKKKILSHPEALKTGFILLGISATIWFFIRVIPKPSRASYPCQRAAFPIASAFVIWLTTGVTSLFAVGKLRNKFAHRKYISTLLSASLVLTLVVWFYHAPTNIPEAFASITGDSIPKAVGFDWKPDAINKPIGVAYGIFPGRVVWAHDPSAAHWSGNWKQKSDQWYLDKNTDQEKVEGMLSSVVNKITGAPTNEEAWKMIFGHYNKKAHNLEAGYQPGEVVAVKINLNNSSVTKTDNQTDASPQMVLAVVKQLVEKVGVPQQNIIVYDARRAIYPAMLLKIWETYKDVRFVQQDAPVQGQPVNPAYGDYHGLEAADWVDGITYSAGKFKNAKLIPRQIKEATYLINLALLKLHSYPYNYMEDGDEGQTALTMIGKNHCGSIKGTSELHSILNTKKEGKKNAYSPLVDLASSPNLGAKTILYLLDGLYCGRKWRCYPLHFPNPPFNNKATPYENPEWPSCVLGSLDEVALESVGLDIMYSQSKNNNEPAYHNVPRILVRENADDFLNEMATPQNAPSGTKYIQNGKLIESLGVHEHWKSDTDRRYTRNLDRKNGKGIELVYLPFAAAPTAEPIIKKKGNKVSIRCATPNANVYYTLDGTTPTEKSIRYTGSFSGKDGMTVKAIATNDQLRDSRVVELN